MESNKEQEEPWKHGKIIQKLKWDTHRNKYLVTYHEKGYLNCMGWNSNSYFKLSKLQKDKNITKLIHKNDT